MGEIKNTDSIKLSFIGEVMLGREVGESYEKKKQQIVNVDIKNINLNQIIPAFAFL